MLPLTSSLLQFFHTITTDVTSLPATLASRKYTWPDPNGQSTLDGLPMEYFSANFYLPSSSTESIVVEKLNYSQLV